MALFIDNLRSNPNARVVVDSLGAPGGSYVTGFIMQDFAFGGRNSFNSAIEAILGAKRALEDVNAAYRMVSGLTNVMGGNMASRTISAGDSVSSWISSDRPRFSLPLLFLAINDGDDPRAIARQLVQYVYPSGSPNSILTAPLGYSANFYSYGSGCCSIRIGRWFATPRLFVVKSLELTVSQRTDRSGVPLYVGAMIEFEASRTMTADEVSLFFLGG